jgi:hypothetical protein
VSLTAYSVTSNVFIYSYQQWNESQYTTTSVGVLADSPPTQAIALSKIRPPRCERTSVHSPLTPPQANLDSPTTAQRASTSTPPPQRSVRTTTEDEKERKMYHPPDLVFQRFISTRVLHSITSPVSDPLRSLLPRICTSSCNKRTRSRGGPTFHGSGHLAAASRCTSAHTTRVTQQPRSHALLVTRSHPKTLAPAPRTCFSRKDPLPNDRRVSHIHRHTHRIFPAKRVRKEITTQRPPNR